MDCCRMGRGFVCVTSVWALPWQDRTPLSAQCSAQPEPGCWWLTPRLSPVGAVWAPSSPRAGRAAECPSPPPEDVAPHAAPGRLQGSRLRSGRLCWVLGTAGRLRSHTLSTTAPRRGKARGDTPRTLAMGAAAGRGCWGAAGGLRVAGGRAWARGCSSSCPAVAGQESEETAGRGSGGELSPGAISQGCT